MPAPTRSRKPYRERDRRAPPHLDAPSARGDDAGAAPAALALEGVQGALELGRVGQKASVGVAPTALAEEAIGAELEGLAGDADPVDHRVNR